MTEDVVRFFNAQLGQDLTPIFDQYLRRASLPVLELAFDEKAGTVAYRWRAEERGFAMPIRIGDPKAWQTIRPTADLADHEDGPSEGHVRRRHRPLLRRGGETVAWGLTRNPAPITASEMHRCAALACRSSRAAFSWLF